MNQYVSVPKHMQKMGTMTPADKRKMKQAECVTADI